MPSVCARDLPDPQELVGAVGKLLCLEAARCVVLHLEREARFVIAPLRVDSFVLAIRPVVLHLHKMKPLLFHVGDVVGDTTCIYFVIISARIAYGVVNASDDVIYIKIKVIFQPGGYLVF